MKFYTVKELAEIFKVSELTLRKEIKNGNLKCFQASRGIRVSEDQFKAYLKTIEVKNG